MTILREEGGGVGSERGGEGEGERERGREGWRGREGERERGMEGGGRTAHL